MNNPSPFNTHTPPPQPQQSGGGGGGPSGGGGSHGGGSGGGNSGGGNQPFRNGQPVTPRQNFAQAASAAELANLLASNQALRHSIVSRAAQQRASVAQTQAALARRPPAAIPSPPVRALPISDYRIAPGPARPMPASFIPPGAIAAPPEFQRAAAPQDFNPRAMPAAYTAPARVTSQEAPASRGGGGGGGAPPSWPRTQLPAPSGNAALAPISPAPASGLDFTVPLMLAAGVVFAYGLTHRKG